MLLSGLMDSWQIFQWEMRTKLVQGRKDITRIIGASCSHLRWTCPSCPTYLSKHCQAVVSEAFLCDFAAPHGEEKAGFKDTLRVLSSA